MNDTQEYYIKCDEIIEQGLCTEDELSIAVRFGGASMATLEKLIECKNELQAQFALVNDTLKELSISIACLLDEPSDISINDIEHLQDLVTKLENTL